MIETTIDSAKKFWLESGAHSVSFLVDGIRLTILGGWGNIFPASLVEVKHESCRACTYDYVRTGGSSNL